MIKKIILTTILIMAMLNIATLTSAIQESNIKSNYETYDDYTHTVLVEFGTSETCTHCPPVSEYLQSIYQSNHDIYIVTLNADEKPAKNRVYSELPNNPMGGLPCVWIDGGFKTIAGDKGSSKPYKKNIDDCGKREVADIDLKLSLTWEDTNIGVNLEVTNNEQSTYDGYIHAYITEIESRWEYYTNGDSFHYAMLDYAINKDITISENNKKQYTANWDGSSEGFPDITQDNIMVIVSVFSKQTDYADATVALKASEAGNEEPTPPPPETNKTLDIKIKNGFNIGFFGLNIKNIAIEVENNGYSNLTYNIVVSTFLSKKIVEENGTLEETDLIVKVEGHTGFIKIKATVSSDDEISVSDSKIGFIIGPIILLK